MKKVFAFLVMLLMVGCGSSSLDIGGSSQGSPSTTTSSSPSGVSALRSQGIPVTFHVTGDWGSGFGAELVLTNLSGATLNDWTVEFDSAFTIDSLWNAQWVKQGAGYRLTPESWNGTLAPGASLTIGFNGHPGGPPQAPTAIRFNGQAVGSTPVPSPTPSLSPSPTPTQSPAPTPPPATGSVQVTPTITGDWGSGFGANIAIKNNGGSALTNWTLRFDLEGSRPVKIDSIWSVKVLSVEGSTVTVGPVSWNQTIAPGGTVEFGFNGSPGSATISRPVFLSDGQSPTPTPEPTPTTTPSPGPTPDPTPAPTPDPTPGPPASGDGPGLVAYFAEWGIYDRNYLVTDIPADSVNVINYAFARIVNGEVAVFDAWAATDKAFAGDTWDQPERGNFHQLRKLKAAHPHLKTMISVGGWTLSGAFSDVALTDLSRQKFARSAVSFIKTHGFDGVDIDWEYPVSGGLSGNVYRPEDKRNYTLLLRELRLQLDAQGALDGRRYLLSIAAPAGSDKHKNLELAAIGEVVDWINVMTYDLHGGWENVANHHAPLWRNPQDPTAEALGYTVDAAISAYLTAGVPPHKVVLGVPAYGRSWVGTQGLFQIASGVGPGTWEPGVFDYKDLVSRRAQQPSVYQRLWDAAAQVPYIVAPSLSGLFVSYEDEQSMAAKIAYARERKLGGFLLWELSGDVKDPERPESLVGTMARALHSWP